MVNCRVLFVKIPVGKTAVGKQVVDVAVQFACLVVGKKLTVVEPQEKQIILHERCEKPL